MKTDERPGMDQEPIPQRRQRRLKSFCFALPIATLGGMMGLGGAEFRLPVLAGPLGYSAHRAVPINLAVSLITLATALVIRGATLDLSPLAPLASSILALISGAVIAAFFGAGLAARLSLRVLEKAILGLLLLISGLLLIEAFLPDGLGTGLPQSQWVRLPAGFLFGLAIGLVSSMLGVAGGELIIPTLLFAFGADIKTAGTASLIISIPTVTVGLIRYARIGAFQQREDWIDTVVYMGVGSVIGAVLGGLMTGIIAASVLKFVLGLILAASAWKTFRKIS